MGKIRFKDFLIDYLEYNNITNRDFANRIGISDKHLIDILQGNRDISSKLIDNISFVTNIPADYIYRIEFNYKIENDIEEYLKNNNLTEVQYLEKFNYKYLKKVNFLDFVDRENNLELIKDILKFLRISSPDKVNEIDRKAYFKSKNDKPELLLLWLEKCYRETLKQNVREYRKENIDILVDYILESAKKDVFDENELISLFNDNGIFLVIQDDIPGSKIRGAFRVHRGKPAIYLTHKHKRIADIYFALLHELAHCKSDFNMAQSTSLVSYGDECNELEDRADRLAYNWMVDNDYYKNICNSFGYDLNFEDRFPKSFVVYRMANDGLLKYGGKEYQDYNFLLNVDKLDYKS